MSNTTNGASAPTTHQFETVNFHGDAIYVVEHNNEPYVPMRGIVENMDLDWATQYSRLNKHRQRFCVVKMTTQVPGDKQTRQTICIPVRKLPAFLAGINPNKVKNELRAKIITYQNECDDALWNYWTKGHAANHRQLSSANSKPLLADLAEQFQQTSLALNSPELSDAQRWELASKITAALFGTNAAYMLGEGEVKVYKSKHLKPSLTREKYDLSLEIMSLTEEGLTLSIFAYTIFAKNACEVKEGTASSETGLYEAFCQWFIRSFDHAAPHLELFKTLISKHHRRISLAGQPWYLGISPKSQSKEVEI